MSYMTCPAYQVGKNKCAIYGNECMLIGILTDNRCSTIDMDKHGIEDLYNSKVKLTKTAPECNA